MSIKVRDLDTTEPWRGDAMLPVGWHDVVIEEATEGKSRTGKDEVEVRFVGEQGDIRDWFYFTDEAKARPRALLDAVGIVPESGEWEFPTGQLVNKRLRIRVGEEPHRDYPDKMRKRVFAYAPREASETGSDGKPLPF